MTFRTVSTLLFIIITSDAWAAISVALNAIPISAYIRDKESLIPSPTKITPLDFSNF